MTWEAPLWLQNVKFSARLDRNLIEAITRRQPRVFRGLTVTQHSPAANFSVDIAEGDAIVIGNSQDHQGAYYCNLIAPETITASPTPAAARTDRLVVHVRDPQAGGDAGDDAALEWIDGGATLPTDAIVIAEIARTPGESAILDTAITDVAPRGEWSWTVSSSPPTGRGVPGDLWVEVS